MEDFKKAKARVLCDLTEALSKYKARLDAVDVRLYEYAADAISNDGSHANLYELLGIRKELRLMDSYEVNSTRVQMVVRAIEGIWDKKGWKKGGLKFDTPRGNMNVRLMPYQVWCLFGIYGFSIDVDMERQYTDDTNLLPSEFVSDGRVWDKRRLCTEAHIFQTRKSGKTEFGAAIDFTEVCFLGPANGQALICTNSREQSKIAYKAIKEFAYQIDPTCLNKMGGKYFRVTADEMNWQPGHPRKGEIKVMSAGGKTKDGLYGSVVHADEHGQADYTNGNSPMQSLVDVCYGSMGPRREKLLLHTTTAGLVKEGPYKNQIQTIERILMDELEFQLGTPHRTADDYWFAFLLRLDPWEVSYDIDELDNSELFKKVNRSIGITVQPTWYKERLHAARNSEDTKKEVLTKDFNIWQTGRIVDWIKPDEIRALQGDWELRNHKRGPRSIADCKQKDGWVVFVGCDFSKGDDWNGNGYLAYNRQTKDFFADTDLWMSDDACNKSTLRELFRKWANDKWLNIVPGATFSPEVVVNRIVSLLAGGVDIWRIGYDPYNAKIVVNALAALVHDLGKEPRQFIVPVRQNFATYNGVVNEFDYMIHRSTIGADGKTIRDPMIHFSPTPLLPFQFGNCQLAESNDGMSNFKPVKASGAANKVDSVQMILSALWLFDQADGSEHPKDDIT